MNLLVDAGRLLLLAFFGSAAVVNEQGLATRYGDPGDRLTGRHLSCTHQPLEPGQLACAHRTLPCGTLVWLHNPRTNRMGMCQVLDRGPFGAILPSGKWAVKIRASQPGRWRGIIDLAPTVAEAIGFNGREQVELFYQKVAQHLHVARGLPRTFEPPQNVP